MSRSEWHWFLATLTPFAYLAADVAVWWFSTPLGFQRFGSVGVLLAAVLFGLDRLSQLRRRRPLKGTDELMLTEIALVALATAQWGYGDLFHCWTHGFGWTPCG